MCSADCTKNLEQYLYLRLISERAVEQQKKEKKRRMLLYLALVDGLF